MLVFHDPLWTNYGRSPKPANTADPPLTLTLSICSKSCHGHFMDVANSVVQHFAHLLIRWTSYPNLRKILQRLDTSFVLLTYGTVERRDGTVERQDGTVERRDGTVERRHVALVSLKFTTKPWQCLVLALVLMLPFLKRSLRHLAFAWLFLGSRFMIASATGEFSSGHLSHQRDTWTDNARKCPNFCLMTDRSVSISA